MEVLHVDPVIRARNVRCVVGWKPHGRDVLSTGRSGLKVQTLVEAYK